MHCGDVSAAVPVVRRINDEYPRVAVESSLDRISFGMSALGVTLSQRVSLPMTATLVKLFEPGGRPCLPYLPFAVSNS